jgi:hypothetical protein
MSYLLKGSPMKKWILFFTILSSTAAFAGTLECVGTRSVKIELKLLSTSGGMGLQFVSPPSNIGAGNARAGDVVNLQRDFSVKSCELWKGVRSQDGIEAQVCIPANAGNGNFIANAAFVFPESNFGSTSEFGYEISCRRVGP